MAILAFHFRESKVAVKLRIMPGTTASWMDVFAIMIQPIWS